MAANQMEFFMVWREICHQILLAKKSKQCEIYRLLFDVYGEKDFSKKCLQIGLTWICTIHLGRKTDRRLETHWPSSAEKFLAVTEGHVDNLLWHELTDHSWFPLKKSATVNSVSDCQILGQYFILFIEWPLYVSFNQLDSHLFLLHSFSPFSRLYIYYIYKCWILISFEHIYIRGPTRYYCSWSEWNWVQR